jgi:hypothetical protein|tara:strand:- start:559 stop:756 length:198 start_codon:yes stop_codon:yes gene_type:complete
MVEQADIPVAVTTEDVQAVMQSNPLMALQVQVRALSRKLGEMTSENQRLTEELETAKNGNTPKED